MGSAVIPLEHLDRLAKLCGMFGSHHDGERSAAALKADALVRSLGLTWHELLVPTSNSLDDDSDPHITAVRCLRYTEVLTDWEIGFLRSVAGRRRLSEKQIAIINKVAAKVEAYLREGTE